MPKKTDAQRLRELAHDTHQLYFLLGALTDAIDRLPELHKQHVLNTLQAKAAACPDEFRDSLTTLIESMTFEE